MTHHIFLGSTFDFQDVPPITLYTKGYGPLHVSSGSIVILTLPWKCLPVFTLNHQESPPIILHTGFPKVSASREGMLGCVCFIQKLAILTLLQIIYWCLPYKCSLAAYYAPSFTTPPWFFCPLPNISQGGADFFNQKAAQTLRKWCIVRLRKKRSSEPY